MIELQVMPLNIDTQYSCHLCFDQKNVNLDFHHL